MLPGFWMKNYWPNTYTYWPETYNYWPEFGLWYGWPNCKIVGVDVNSGHFVIIIGKFII